MNSGSENVWNKISRAAHAICSRSSLEDFYSTSKKRFLKIPERIRWAVLKASSRTRWHSRKSTEKTKKSSGWKSCPNFDWPFAVQKTSSFIVYVGRSRLLEVASSANGTELYPEPEQLVPSRAGSVRSGRKGQSDFFFYVVSRWQDP